MSTVAGDARRLLSGCSNWCGQGQIENGLHYRRDGIPGEDHSQLRLGHTPLLLAILNTIGVGLVARQGRTNLAEARREFAYHLERAFSSPAA